MDKKEGFDSKSQIFGFCSYRWMEKRKNKNQKEPQEGNDWRKNPKNPRPFNHTFEACGELSTSRTDLPEHKHKNKRQKMGHVVAEETESNGTASQCRSWTTRQLCCSALGHEPFRGNAPFDGATNVPKRGRQRPGEFPPKQSLKKGCCLACACQVLLPVPAGSHSPPPPNVSARNLGGAAEFLWRGGRRDTVLRCEGHAR